jgi:hypothetical protein
MGDANLCQPHGTAATMLSATVLLKSGLTSVPIAGGWQ